MLESIKILENNGIKYRLIKLAGNGISFADVIKNAQDNINPNEICKTIIVKDKKDNKYAFFLKGNQKIDFQKAKEIIGEKINILSYEDLKKTTGKEPGAICPFLLNIPIFIDKRVFETEKINFGSGDHLYGLEINSKDLDKIMKFKIIDIAQN